jgi:hypothetical protein
MTFGQKTETLVDLTLPQFIQPDLWKKPQKGTHDACPITLPLRRAGQAALAPLRSASYKTHRIAGAQSSHG